MIKAGFIPDSISTDLHVASMNGAMKDELNVADKIMAVDVPLKQVVAEMTSHPAHEIRHDELGNLSEGAIADVRCSASKKVISASLTWSTDAWTANRS